MKFYDEFKSSGFNVDDKKKKVFRLYHLYGDHEPYTMSSKAERVDKSSCEEQTAGTIHIVDKMLDDMKEKGIYDDSTIIIVADHGDVYKAEYSMMMIKDAGNTDEYKVSHVPASAFDLTYYLAALAGKTPDGQEYGLPIDTLEEGMERERHMFHNKTNDNKFVIEEYMTTSEASDHDALKLVKVHKETEDENTPYVLGTELSFQTDATGNKYCIEGIGSSSGFRSVLRGPYAAFSFPIKDLPDSGSITVHFDLHPKTVKGLKMKVTANGEEVLDAETDEEMIQSGLDIEIPVSVFKDSDKLKLEFSFPDISEDEMNVDVRKRSDTLSLLSMVIDK